MNHGYTTRSMMWEICFQQYYTISVHLFCETVTYLAQVEDR